ncbi:MAG TPA: HNH endonuclease [Luteimonas sp.]|nr:HNH endonuclease [Luteimonas sp.]HRP73292.1 HNH endonuclease [Luteimonas sp.]
MKKIKTEVKIKRVTPDGVEDLRMVTEDVQVVDKDSADVRSMNAMSSLHADACIYCSSTEQLSSEHVIPFAWGGTLQIHRGSCEKCRHITSQFENYALNDGAMPHVRKALSIPSRSGHKNAKNPPETSLSGKDGQEIILADDALAPLILGLPLFVRPGQLVGDGKRLDLRLKGMGAVAFGVDVASFLDRHEASAVRQKEVGKRTMPFARAIAKIAYGWAWRDGALEKLSGTEHLVDAFMNHPEKRLGAFVGTKPPPYERYLGCQLRLEYKLSMPSQLVYMEVQIFADSAAPIYEVVLGRVESVREWRRMNQSLRN